MARGFNSDTANEGSTSKFNEAFLKMHRINRLQDMINIASINPLAFNLELNVYNYEVIIRSCSALLKECWGKLSDDERKDAVQLKTALEESLKKFKIHQEVTWHNHEDKKIKFHRQNWEVLEKYIFNYDTKIRELLSSVGYDSPNADEFDEDDF